MNDPTSPTAPTAPTSTTPAVAPQVEPNGQNGITPEQAAKMIEWEKINLAQGRISLAEATTRFDALGATPEQRITEDTRSDEVKLLDQHFPVPQPTEYTLHYQDVPMTPQITQFDQSTRAWLSGAEFPRELGNSLVTTITKTAQQTQHMTAGELEMYGYAEYARLRQAYGDTLEDKLNAAGRMVVALDQKMPGLKNLLRSRGLGDSALIASLLIQQSERYWARRKGR